MSRRLWLGLLALAASSLANGANQDPLDKYRDACPDYVSYSTYPQ